MTDLAQQIKARVLLSSVVKDVVRLRGRSPNFLGLCPFHQEKTPSFHVRDGLGRYKCFGCGAAGDAFEFLMRLRGITFNEAKAELANKAGLQTFVSTRDVKTTEPKSHQLLQAQTVAHHYFVSALQGEQGLLAKNYLLKERGLRESMINQAAIGYGGSYEGLVACLRKHNISERCAIEAGLLKAPPYKESQFAGRIIFPIRDFSGSVVAFGGRSFLPQDQGPKYVNTHSYAHYEKRKNFYGLFESKAAILKGQAPVLVEGYFDAMAFWALGIPAIASCGTALSADHATILSRLSARLLICFDADNAGFLALKNALLEVMQKNIVAKVINLSAAKDPGDFLAQAKLPELSALVSSASDALTFLIDQAAVSAQGNIDDRIRHIDELLPIFASIKRPLLRRQYVFYLANALHEDSRLLWSEVESRIKALRGKSSKKNAHIPEKLAKESFFTTLERLVLQIVIADPSLLGQALALIEGSSQEVCDIVSTTAQGVAELGHVKAHAAIGPWVFKKYPTWWANLKEVLEDVPVYTPVEALEALNALKKKAERASMRALVHKKRLEVVQYARSKNYQAVIEGLKEQSALLLSSRPKKTPIATPQRFIKPVGESKKVQEIKRIDDETTFFDPAEDWL